MRLTKGNSFLVHVVRVYHDLVDYWFLRGLEKRLDVFREEIADSNVLGFALTFEFYEGFPRLEPSRPQSFPVLRINPID